MGEISGALIADSSMSLRQELQEKLVMTQSPNKNAPAKPAGQPKKEKRSAQGRPDSKTYFVFLITS
jgi:hypothetical protein